MTIFQPVPFDKTNRLFKYAKKSNTGEVLINFLGIYLVLQISLFGKYTV